MLCWPPPTSTDSGPAGPAGQVQWSAGQCHSGSTGDRKSTSGSVAPLMVRSAMVSPMTGADGMQGGEKSACHDHVRLAGRAPSTGRPSVV